jgi:FkbM family methyltransferase
VAVPPRVSRLQRRVTNAARLTAALPDKRRSLPRWAVFTLLRRATPLAAVEQDGLRFVLRTADRGVSRVTYMTGDYELDVMQDALARLARALGHDPLAGRTFVDVGANVGTSSLPAVVRFGASRAIAFEPAEENFRILSANVALNGLVDRVVARRVGISDAAGTAELELAPSNSGDHRIRTATGAGAFDAYREASRATAPVELVRLDDALSDAGVDPSEVGLLWVDTQGHEGHVLAGAPRLLAAGVPAVCEYWPYGLRRAGGLELFHATVERSFAEVIDVRAGDALPATRVVELADRYPDERFSDLVLVPRAGAST